MKAGDWVRIVGGNGHIGTVGKLSLSMNGDPYVNAEGSGTPVTWGDVEPADEPDHPPWSDGAGATDVDGFLAAYALDDNTFWAMESGHAQNVIDELISRVSAARTDERERIRVALRKRGLLVSTVADMIGVDDA